MEPVFKHITTRLRSSSPAIRKFFECSHCLQRSARPTLSPPQRAHILQRLSKLNGNARSFSFTSTRISTDTPLGALGRTIITENAEPKRYFPKQDSRAVAYWLFGSAASVFGLVVLGALTRLTESGLSITEWKPITGSLPPMSDADWASEFNKYRASPEYAQLNPNMTLPEFKQIYWMEWGHRLWGRVVGLSFVGPLAYFALTKRISARTAIRASAIGSLIGFQGFVGWWMVKSGLRDDLFEPGQHPRVSQYRLVSHLGVAFTIYSAMVWTGLDSLKHINLLSEAARRKTSSLSLYNATPKSLRGATLALAGLVFVTAMSGGIVAGLDAGMIYNEFPLMGGRLTPPSSELFSDFYSRKADGSDRWWRNMLENPSMAQLDHRILATTSFFSIMGLWAYTHLAPEVKKKMSGSLRQGVRIVVGFAFLQVAMGIGTLLYLVPIPLAAAHQAGSLALLTSVLALRSRTAVPASLARRVKDIVAVNK